MPVTSGFRCVADITYNGMEATATLDRTDAKKTVVEFSSPTELVGLSMTYEDGVLSAYYAGFRVQINEEAVPVANVAKMIDDMFSQLSEHTERSPSEYVLENGRVQVDPDTYFPSKMEIPSHGLTILFSEWEHMGVEQ